MRYLKEADKLDVNINVTSLVGVVARIKEEVQGTYDKQVLLYSERYTIKQVKDAINNEWNESFYNYLTRRNIDLVNIIAIKIV